MKRRFSTFGLLLAAMMAMPATPALAAFSHSSPAPYENESNELHSRKGGGGRSGGSRGGSSRSFSKGRTGFKHSGSSLNRGSKPPQSGWSKSSKSKNGPSIDFTPRGSVTRDRNRSGNWDGNRNINRDNYRRIDRRNDYNRGYNRGYNRASSRWRRYDNRYRYRGGWARPGWRYARPWNYGWYGGRSRPNWSWWGANAAAWGVSTLATAAIINSAVDRAVTTKTEYIVVPNSDYELYYGSVQPTNDDSVSFLVKADDGDYQISADCKSGTIDGQSPGNAAEAELLNAACQVAFGAA